MALTNQPSPIVAHRPLGLGHTPILHGNEKAAQTFKRGAPIQDDDAGRLTESASPVDGSAVTKRCIGFTLADASTVTDTDVAVVVAWPHQLFEATLSDATAGTHTLALTDMWKIFPITKATANWYLDANAVSDTGGGVVVGFKDPILTVDGRVYFMVTAPARGGANAGSAAW